MISLPSIRDLIVTHVLGPLAELWRRVDACVVAAQDVEGDE